MLTLRSSSICNFTHLILLEHLSVVQVLRTYNQQTCVVLLWFCQNTGWRKASGQKCHRVWWVCCPLFIFYFFQEGFGTQYWGCTVSWACCLSLVFTYTNKWRKKMFVQEDGNHIHSISATSPGLGHDRLQTTDFSTLLSSCSRQQDYVMFAISRVTDQQRT